MFGLPDRNTGKVRLHHVRTRRKHTIHAQIRANVGPGSKLHTDVLKSYEGLDSEYPHKVIDHAEAFVVGNVHTDKLDNFWSLLKRSIKDTYASVEPFHLFGCLDEQAFRHNERKAMDAERFHMVLVA